MRKLYSIEAFGALWSVRGAEGGETTPSFGHPSNVRRGETTPSFGHPSNVRRGGGGTSFVDERSEAHKGLLSNLPREVQPDPSEAKGHALNSKIIA